MTPFPVSEAPRPVRAAALFRDLCGRVDEPLARLRGRGAFRRWLPRPPPLEALNGLSCCSLQAEHTERPATPLQPAVGFGLEGRGRVGGLCRACPLG